DGNFGLLDHAGNGVIEPRFAMLGRFASGLATAEVRGQQGTGYIDHSGDWRIPPQYWVAGQFGDGLAPVAQWVGGGNSGHSECHYITPDGETALDDQWNHCNAFEYGMAVVDRDDKGQAVIDRQGDYIVECGRAEYARLLAPGRIRIRDGEQMKLVDGDGEVLFAVPSHGRLHDADGQRMWYRRDESGKVGLLDMQTGEPIVTPDRGWQSARAFSDGVAWVRVKDPQRRWALVDRQGKQVLEPSAHGGVNAFHAGAAAITDTDGNWQLIDKDGSVLSDGLYRRMRPAWYGFKQSPRPGDVWRARRKLSYDNVDWVNAHGQRLFYKRHNSCDVAMLFADDGRVLWPQLDDAQAMAELCPDAGSVPSWRVPDNFTNISQAEYMARLIDNALEDLAVLAAQAGAAEADAPTRQAV